MPRPKLQLILKLACCMASICILKHLHGSSYESQDDSFTDDYFDTDFQLVRRRQRSPPQRKLTNIYDKRGFLRNVHIYDLQQPLPQNRSFECVTSGTAPSFQICVYDPNVDKFISAALLSDGIWEPYITKIFQKALNKYPDSLVIDVGANIGYYTLLSAKMGHPVIAVEPLYENAIRFQKGVQLGQFRSNIYLAYNALSDRHENVSLTMNVDNQGGISVRQRIPSDNKLTPPVATATMDDLMGITDFSQAIIKIDIEGYECKAMGQARKLLKTVYVPYIFMEWKKMFDLRNAPHSSCPRGEMEKLTHTLVQLGYIPTEVRTGFLMDVTESSSNWYIGDLYWRHNTSKMLQAPY